MREQAPNSADQSLDNTRAAARRMPAAVGFIAVALLLGFAGPAPAGNQGDLILNEINAVGETKYLKGKGADFIDAYVDDVADQIYVSSHSFSDEQGPFRLTTTGTLPPGLSLDTDYYVVLIDASNIGLSLTPGGAQVDIGVAAAGGIHTMKLPPEEGDSYFGVIPGNGGNWLELVVIADHLDIRGWTFEWENEDLPPPTGCNSGTVTFEAYDIWSDLRSGTIITVAEDLPDDLSYDPSRGDWWINANHEQGAVSHTECFKVDNDCWRMRIWDGTPESSNLIQDWVGENNPACLVHDNLWAGTGDLSSREVGKLEQDPSAAAATSPPMPAYNDGTSSSFGSPNRWDQNTMRQDFSDLRPRILSVPSLTTSGAALLASLIVGSVFWLARRRASAG